MGWLLYYFNKRAIVLTDRRILLLQIHGGDRPGVLRSQVRYAPAVMPASWRRSIRLLRNFAPRPS